VSAPELKYVDTYVTDVTNPGNAGTATASVGLSALVQGAEYNQRIGRSINMDKIQYDVMFSSSQGTTTVIANNGFPFSMQWAIVIDTECNGSLANYGNVFDLSSFNTSVGQAFVNNSTARNRFHMIKSGEASWIAGQSMYRVRGTCSLKNLPYSLGQVEYSGTAGTNAAITKNALIFVYGECNCDAGGVSIVSGCLSAGFRLTYLDA